jgi:hypothetical protein
MQVRDLTAADLGQTVRCNGYRGFLRSMTISDNLEYIELVFEDDGERSVTWVKLDAPASVVED